MNAECRRFVYEETERGRDWERIEQLEAENKKARAILQRMVDWYEVDAVTVGNSLLDILHDAEALLDD